MTKKFKELKPGNQFKLKDSDFIFVKLNTEQKPKMFDTFPVTAMAIDTGNLCHIADCANVIVEE